MSLVNSTDATSTVNTWLLTPSGTNLAAALTGMTNGQLIIGDTGTSASVGSLTAGTNITITPGAGSISIASASGNLTSRTILTSGSGATYNVPAGINTIVVECVAGGGGGAGVTGTATTYGIGGGGGAGSYSKKSYFNVSGNSYLYTVGTGGSGGAAGTNNGNNGNNTIFDVITCNGGLGGISKAGSTSGDNAIGGSGGTVSTGGDTNWAGGPGGTGIGINNSGVSGSGGNSAFGGGAIGVLTSNDGNNASPNSGAGGSGACSVGTAINRAGGSGATGIIVIYEYA